MHCQNKMDEGLFMQITANLNLKKKKNQQKTEHTRTFYDYCSVHSALFQNKLFSLFMSAGWHLSPFITHNFQYLKSSRTYHTLSRRHPQNAK